MSGFKDKSTKKAPFPLLNVNNALFAPEKYNKNDGANPAKISLNGNKNMPYAEIYFMPDATYCIKKEFKAFHMAQ